jgi:hypothetical protein
MEETLRTEAQRGKGTFMEDSSGFRELQQVET